MQHRGFLRCVLAPLRHPSLLLLCFSTYDALFERLWVTSKNSVDAARSYSDEQVVRACAHESFLLSWLSIPSGFLVVFEKPNRSSFTFFHKRLVVAAFLPINSWR